MLKSQQDLAASDITRSYVNLRLGDISEHCHGVPMTTAALVKTLDLYTRWADFYPSARFVVIAVAPDGTDAEVLGWGLALPEHVFTYLPEIGVTGSFQTADSLLRTLNRTLDTRLIWVDPEPEHWPGDPEED
jgi:hypothetical protein